MMNNAIISVLTVLALSGCLASAPNASADAREVFKPEGSRQCEPDSGVAEGALRAELEALRIPVLAYRSGHDGRFYPAVCGAPTGRIHVFSIPASAVPAAEARGYRLLDK
jgi:hypothetical protein